MVNKIIPYNTTITLELEGTFLEEQLKGLSIMPSIKIEYRYDWDGEYGAPCKHEFTFIKISIKNKSDYASEIHDCILDLLDSKEDDFIETFLEELWTNWGEYATDYLDAESEYRARCFY